MSNSRTPTPHTSPPSSPPPIRRTRRRDQRGPFQEGIPSRTMSNNSLASNTSAFSAPAIRRARSEESLTRAMSQMHIQRPMPPPLDFYLNNSRHFAPIQPNARTNTRTRRNQQNSDDSEHYVTSNASSSSRSSDSSSTRERRERIRRARRTRTTRRRRRR